MARGPTSRADLILIAELAAQGIEVSPYQLERWRRWGQLPRPERRGRGRGRGSASRYPPGSAQIAAVLAHTGGQGRSRHVGTLALFRLRLPVSEAAVRGALAQVIEDDHRRVRQLEERHEFYVADLAARARRAVKVDFPALRGITSVEGPTRAQLRARARRRRELQRFYSLKVQMRYGELSSDELEEDLAALGPELAQMFAAAVRESEHQTARASTGAPDGTGWRLWADQCDFERISLARDVLDRLARANASLHHMAQFWDTPGRLLADLASTPMSAELMIVSDWLCDPFEHHVAFAELTLGLASIEGQLIATVIHTWFIETVIGPSARGLDMVLEYARVHQTQPQGLPTFEQLEMIGLADRLSAGEAEGHDDGRDLAAALRSFGIEPSADVEALAEIWAEQWDTYTDDKESDSLLIHVPDSFDQPGGAARPTR